MAQPNPTAPCHNRLPPPVSQLRGWESVCVCEREGERQRGSVFARCHFLTDRSGMTPRCTGPGTAILSRVCVNGRQTGAGYWAQWRGHLTQDQSWRAHCPPLPRCANRKRVCVCATNFLFYLLFPVQTLTFSQVSLIIRRLECVFATASVRSS